MAVRKQTNYKIPQELYDEIQAKALAEGRTATDVVIQGLSQYVGHNLSTKFGESEVPEDNIESVSERLQRLEEKLSDPQFRTYGNGIGIHVATGTSNPARISACYRGETDKILTAITAITSAMQDIQAQMQNFQTQMEDMRNRVSTIESRYKLNGSSRTDIP